MSEVKKIGIALPMRVSRLEVMSDGIVDMALVPCGVAGPSSFKVKVPGNVEPPAIRSTLWVLMDWSGEGALEPAPDVGSMIGAAYNELVAVRDALIDELGSLQEPGAGDAVAGMETALDIVRDRIAELRKPEGA